MFKLCIVFIVLDKFNIRMYVQPQYNTEKKSIGLHVAYINSFTKQIITFVRFQILGFELKIKTTLIRNQKLNPCGICINY